MLPQTAPMARHLRTVFLSSTFEDLKRYRARVIAMLEQAGLHVLAMEKTMGALPADATEASLDSVAECDIVVGIYAYSYGSVPEGATTSITEQEFDHARKLGKRCLCYMASDRDAFPVSATEAAVQAFKNRIATGLVRDTFTTPDDLASKVAADMVLFARGSPLGVTADDVRTRWVGWQQREAGRLREEALFGRTGSLVQPLRNAWLSFLQAKPWHTWLAGELQCARSHAASVPGLEDLARDLHSIEPAQRYVDCSADLRGLISVNLRDRLREFRRANDDDASDHRGDEDDEAIEPAQQAMTPQVRNSIRVLDKSLRSLRGAAEHPAYGRCFLVTAGIGDGKTHFLASMLAEGEGAALVLPLHGDSREPLEDQILAAACEASGFAWRSLEELDSLLTNTGTEQRWVVAIDGFERWLSHSDNALDELTRTMSETTSLRGLRWMVTLRDRAFAAVSAPKYDDHWARYSSPALSKNRRAVFDHESGRFEPAPGEGHRFDHPRRSIPALGSWIDLTAIHRDATFGLKMVQQRTKDAGALLALEQLSEPERTTLSSPAIAWILLELRSELPIPGLANLTFIDFVSRFWQQRRAHLVQESGLSDVELRQAVVLVARALTTTPDLSPTFPRLEARMRELAGQDSTLQSPTKASSALRAMVDGKLLTKTEGINAEALPIERVGLAFDAFWQWQLATQMLTSQDQRKVSTLRAQIAAWHASTDRSILAEGIFEFLLLTLDREARESSRAAQLRAGLVRAGATAHDLPKAAPWFFGAKGSIEAQQQLANLAVHEGAARAEVFAFTYFVGEAAAEVLTTPDRTRLLSALYDELRNANLGSYFEAVVERWLRREESAETLVEAWGPLCGSEELGRTPAITAVALSSLTDLQPDPDRVTDAVLTFLVTVTEQGLGRMNRPDGGWHRYFFHDWLIHHFCQWITGSEGVDAYDILVRHCWYAPDRFGRPIDRRIAGVMQREANIAIGHLYRRRDTEQELVELVERLTASDHRHELIHAFFLIRHTEATGGHRSVRVDAAFHDCLRSLYRNRRFPDEIAARYEPSFRVNLSDFDQLRQERGL